MKTDAKKLKGSVQLRKATPQTKLIDEKKRMIPFILISKDNAGERWCCGEIDYIERLDVNGAKFDNLKTFFKDHNISVDSAIGRVENIRVEDGELKADVYFADTEDAIKVFEKYRQGVLNDVSVRYRVNAVTIEEKASEPDLVTVTDFEIREVSAVGIGFDKGAVVGRSEDENLKWELKMTKEEIKKRVEELQKLNKRSKEQDKELEELRAKLFQTEDEEKKELKRQNELKDIALSYDVGQDELRSFLEDKEKTGKDLMKYILDKKREEQPQVYASVKGEDNKKEMIRAVSDGLLLRSGFDLKEPHKDAEMFRGMSVQNMVRKVTGLGLEADVNELMRSMVTSDFPLVLSNVQNKVIQESFDRAPVTFKEWTKSVAFKDFKPRSEVRTTGFNTEFKKLTERGKTEFVEAGEDGHSWRIYSYGARFAFTREMLINDDLGILLEMLNEMVEDVATYQNRLVYDLLQNRGEFKEYKFSDGKPVFDTSHGNYDAVGSAISTEALSKAKVAMSRQKDKNGKSIRVTPKHLLVPVELEVKALEILNSTAKVEAQNSGVANPFRSAFNLISDVELDDPKAWYLTASKKTIKTGYLEGTNGKPIVQELRRDARGIEYDLIFDFGLTVEDYRGLYKNKGA